MNAVWDAVAWVLVPIINRVALPILDAWRRFKAGPA